MYAVAVVVLNALSFASLAYVANRKSGAWLFGVTGVLIWVTR
jgi:hypothetical protein